jgi:SAM-dependent methyltransferase
MKLSELVAYRNQLDALSSVPTLKTASLELDKILHLVGTQPELMTSFTHNLDSQYANIQQAFVKFEDDLNNLKSQLAQQIAQAERPWFQESYTLYEGELMQGAKSILELRKPNTLGTEPFQDRLNQYANWKYSALIIRPGLETFIENMVAYDPLYLVDLSHDYLTPAMNKFNEQYQNRLRPYVVSERLDQDILAKIPDNQFGMCLAYNYFNFRPFEILKKYLTEIYQKLKPGGILAFTFNDCDRPSAVSLVERYYCCYTPGYLVRELAISTGYEIVYSWNDPGPTTWLELRKPGELTSFKGGQTLAKIVPK